MKSLEKPVDVHNDFEMVALGIRVPKAIGRDNSVWQKSDYEKKNAKMVRKQLKHAFDNISWPASEKVTPVRSKLIVYTIKHNNFVGKDINGFTQFKTTFSFDCNQHDIPRILESFTIDKNNIVKKYVWNGKSYNYGELPFWGK